MIFVDTGAWYASVVPSDSNHAGAAAWLAQNTQPLLTTDYVIDETLTLLRARGEMQRAIALGEAFFTKRLATLHYLSESEIQQTWRVFRQFDDKEWSFTDCSSKVAIANLNLTTAFAFDYNRANSARL